MGNITFTTPLFPFFLLSAVSDVLGYTEADRGA
jgi:hypothetical protein